MDLPYLKNITLAFCFCTLFPVAYFLHLSAEKGEQSEVVTEYEQLYVNGPIQPIPKVVAIDRDWLLLGKALFHSPLLSKDNSVSCASCHAVSLGGDDGFAVSTGVNNQKGSRNSPTVLNAVFNFRQFWDGRVPTLALQISGPIHNPVEMATNWPEVIGKLEQDPYFASVFNQLSSQGVSQQTIVKALVTYEESLVTPDSAIDQFLLGDENALTPRQKRGLDKFVNFGCATCHQGKNIGGNFYQKLGRIDAIPDKLSQDFGKFEFTKDPADKYVFKVPSLRNVADTAPYFHNGLVATLPEAVEIMAKTQLGMDISEQDIADIVALLSAFSAPVQDISSND